MEKSYLELRHQRNTDAYFDIQNKANRNGISTQAKQQVYHLIETLLPQTVIPDSKEPLLLELFAENGTSRNGWTSVCQN